MPSVACIRSLKRVHSNYSEKVTTWKIAVAGTRLMGTHMLEDYQFDAYTFRSGRWTEDQVLTASTPWKR